MEQVTRVPIKHGCKESNLLINTQQQEIDFQVILRKGDRLHPATSLPLSITSVNKGTAFKEKNKTKQNVDFGVYNFLCRKIS